MALQAMFGFDYAIDDNYVAVWDSVYTFRQADGGCAAGTYSAFDPPTNLEFARRFRNTGFFPHMEHMVLVAPTDEIVIGFDFQSEDTLGAALTNGDTIEAGFGVGLAMTSANVDRKLILWLDMLTGAWKFSRYRTNNNFDNIGWPGPTLLMGATAAGVVVVGEPWAHYELKANLTTDEVWLRKNDVEIFHAAGMGMGGGVFNRVGCSHNDLGGTRSALVDNWYALSTVGGVRTDYIPQSRIISYTPAADAGPNDWIPNAGVVHFNRLNESNLPFYQLGIHDEDVTYDQSAVAGDRDMFYIVPAVAMAMIYGVQFYAYFKALVADATVNLVATSPGGVDYVYGPFTITTGFALYTTDYQGVHSPVLEVDPETGLDWTDARLALWQFGFENVGGTTVRASMLAVSKIGGLAPPPPPPPPAPMVTTIPGSLRLRVGKPQVRCANVWDWCLDNDKRLWKELDWKSYLCQLPRCWRTPDNPLHAIPEQGREFHKYGAIGIPKAPNVDTQILQFNVPLGYDGILYAVLCKYVGLGFVNGSGDLFWRFQMNRHWIKSLHAISTELGDFTAYAQLEEFIRIYSGQTIRVFGWLSPASGIVPAPDKRMIAAVQGWYYPMGLLR